MHIVVCIKQVPDSAQIRVHPVTNTIMRQGVPTIINPYDLYALEEALRIKDETGAKVTVVTMGPPMADTSLRKALAYGCDNAILLTDRRFAGSDTLATSYALASLLEKIAETDPFDIVFCGKQTIDGDTAQVGPGIAKRLNLTQLTYVAKIESIDPVAKEVVAQRRAEGGVQVLKTKLPCMITMMEGSNKIRFGNMADAFRAARTEVLVMDAEKAGVKNLQLCGLRGSPTVVKKVFAPKAKAKKADQIEVVGKSSAEVAAAAIDAIFAAQPVFAEDLLKQAANGQ